MIWVVDASVAVRWFLADEFHPNAEAVMQQMIFDPESFAVPELFGFEVYAVLERLHPAGSQAFREGVLPILEGGVFRQPISEDLILRANRFVRMGLTGYDACYAALAEDLGGGWLTFDQKTHRIIEQECLSVFLADELPWG